MRSCIICIAFLFFAASFATPVLGIDEYVHIKKGDLAEKEGNFILALEQYDKALKIDPKKYWVYLTVGKIYREKLENTEAAIENYRTGLEHLPSNFLLSRALMYTYFEAGLIKEGMETYENIAKINSENKKFSLTRKVLDELKKSMTETELFKLSINYLSLNPADTLLREFEANHLYKEKKYQEAIASYELLLKYGSNPGPTFFSLALCYYGLQNYDETLKYFKKAESEGEYVPKKYYEIIEEKNHL
jgi:tetratricopeptide (TPR) repeat protein